MSIVDFAIKRVNKLSDKWPWFGGKVNKFAINRLVNQCPHRPHPRSTISSYASWSSLTEKQWSARYLPVPKASLNIDESVDLTALFRRPSNQRLSPSSTCLFPAFAQYLTDGFIRTKMPENSEPNDPTRKQNTSNHNIDLSPLYGRKPSQTNVLRLNSENIGEKGRMDTQDINGEDFPPYLYKNGQMLSKYKNLDTPLMSDEFASKPEILNHLFAAGGDRANASPQVSMMNTLFLREHNRLAGLLEKENPDWDDERVFQVARNANIALYIKIVVEEYINHISPIKFKADPSVAWDAPWNKPNWITTEFSLLYRWHPLIPDSMEWGGSHVTARDSIMNNMPFIEVGLRQGFIDISRQMAGDIGVFNTALALINLEKKAINQGRLCQLASFADYKEYASSERPRSFSDISKNPEVIKILKEAYETIDDVEFYVGLFAEDKDKNAVLPPLLTILVGVDAFSQALTNPLLSKQLWKEETFGKSGWKAIHKTNNVQDVVARNINQPLTKGDFIGITSNN